MNIEKIRLEEANKSRAAWKKWGPYVTERQWGTVREDYSPYGTAWDYTPHDAARSKAYRWGEEGIGGICDDQQLLCFSLALWNKKDPILKERLFGLNGEEGNHGEDVKEYYYYLDNTPTHSYMKMLYKYSQNEFPYSALIEENKKRSKADPEFELIDTGIFNADEYFDVFIEYAKNNVDDVLIRFSIHNRGKSDASLNVLPTLWFRNTWSWGYDNFKPKLSQQQNSILLIEHKKLDKMFLYCDGKPQILFCDNETNRKKLYNVDGDTGFWKDGINDFLISGKKEAVNKVGGTKAAVNYDLNIPAEKSVTIQLRLCDAELKNPFDSFDSIFNSRIKEADEFYSELQNGITSSDARLIQRQALAGMLWTKQFYYYDIEQWLNGDPSQPKPPAQRLKGRNHDWEHLNNCDIISMPDKWEYPWYAAWDLAFHCIPFALLDAEFAKAQLILLTREWYMHPNGQLPAYEWALDDVNPPVHAWAAWRVYKIDQMQNGGKGDTAFLESVFHKMLLNFTWWVNRKDTEGNNLFQGGFLGLDNIGVFDRSNQLPTGGYIEQSDGTSWMAMFSLNMMRIALELSKTNKVYEDLATKFFEHFLYIAKAMSYMGQDNSGLWDEEDQFFYDVLNLPSGQHIKLKVRSMVGLIPLFAVEILDDDEFNEAPEFARRLKWFLDYRPDLASLVSRWHMKGSEDIHLLSLLRGHRMKRILERMLDEEEFLSDYGIRALSKFHEKNPYSLTVNGTTFTVKYTPAEGDTQLFGGNSNWRGPIWMQMNFLIISSLLRFHHYYGPNFKVECPTRSGNFLNLEEVAHELERRLAKIFKADENGLRPVFNNYAKMQHDEHWKDYILFYEYFHGDNGRGVGASHQTGWTGLIAKLLMPVEEESKSKKEKKTTHA